MSETSWAKQKVVATLAVLLVLVVIVAGAKVATAKQDASNNTVSTQSQVSDNDTTTSDTNTATSSTSGTYKDGTYSATGGFNTPGGPDTLTVTVELKDGQVVSTSAQGHATDRESEEYDQRFIESFTQYVEGKNIANLNLSRVAGASLTTIGFNNAIEQIKTDASA